MLQDCEMILISQVPGLRSNTPLKKHRWDNVLPGHGYHTPQGMITDEYREMAK
jgi:hypothetical protein